MEIGGDFWYEEIEFNNNINHDFFEFGEDNYFVMSGRTAIDTALQDILKIKKVKNVYFPSYSCKSMMQPFIDRDIKIDFYDVFFDNTLQYNIDLNHECDIFFAMNYFGYTSTNMDSYIKSFKNKNVIIIEDITHSLLSKKKFSKYSDYLVCSLRKWFPIISGGLVSKMIGKFNVNFDEFLLNIDVINNRKDAMRIKLNSIKQNNLDKNKDEYLSLYKKANKAIKDNYINKKIDDYSLNYLLNVDLDNVILQRKKNMLEIYNNLELNKYKLLINDVDFDNDCLLYIPLYMNNEQLNNLKIKIYHDKFYCPSHWPIDNKINDLFENELSIVCDQRYKSNEVVGKLKKMNKYL